jgi:hypothetical protein
MNQEIGASCGRWRSPQPLAAVCGPSPLGSRGLEIVFEGVRGPSANKSQRFVHSFEAETRQFAG